MKKVGLVGGISWISTIDYYRFINEGINARLGGLNYAECILYSLNFSDIQEATWEGSYPILLQACESLKRSRVDAIALCANTAHLFADLLEKQIGLPFIHIGIATGKAVNQKGLRKIGLLGTKYTMEMEFYKDKLRSYGLEVFIPDQKSTIEYIQHTIKEELGRGIVKPETKQAYIAIAQRLIDRGAEGIILGCTEIPLLLSQNDFSVPVFDTTKIHTQAIVDYMTLPVNS